MKGNDLFIQNKRLSIARRFAIILYLTILFIFFPAFSSYAQPTASAASSVTANSFTANWSSVSGAISYRLDVSASSTFASFISGYNNVSVSGTSKSVTGLSANTVYYYRVRAVKVLGGTTGNSNVISVSTLLNKPIFSVSTNISSTSVTINWSAVAAATSYQLDVSTSSSFNYFVGVYNNYAVNGTSISVTGLNPSTIYFVRVRAINSSNTSANSSTLTIETAPYPPMVYSATEITNNSFKCNWSKITEANGYYIDVSLNSSFDSFLPGYNNVFVEQTVLIPEEGEPIDPNAPIPIDPHNIPDPSFTVTGLNAGTTYYYRVRASGGGGTSSNSSTVEVITASNPPSAISSSNITSTSFTVAWSPVVGASSYAIDVSTSNNFYNYVSGYSNAAVQGTSTVVSGLTPGYTYYYRVRAVNGSGASANSTTLSVLTIPSSPTAKEATEITKNTFIASWNSKIGASSYRLDVSAQPDFSSFVEGYTDLSVSGLSRNVSGLTAATPYYYRVRAVNASGVSDNSNTISLQTVADDGVTVYAGNDTKPKNWTESKVFNGNETVVGHTRTYSDWTGRSIQSQSADFTTGRAVVSAVVYDSLGRQAINTLPAAVISPNLSYKPDFFTDILGKNYSPVNFDGNKLNSPERVNAALPEGLGWYYSAYNTADTNVAESTHPYSRVEYSKLTGQARRSAAAGEHYRMGSEHETYGFTMPASIDELGPYASNKGLPSYGLSKSISVDADGKAYATFTDAKGNTIATARVGGNATTTSYVQISSLGWVDVYIGEGCENSLVLPSCGELKTFSIYDLLNDSLLKKASGTGNAISIGKGFYRIKCNTIFLNGDFEVSYNTKYSELSLYAYDNLGRLLKSYSPKAVESNSPVPTTTYRYNSLGWLLETNSVDEGLSQFVYRRDGTIRFSQNAKQRAEAGVSVFSYTSYDASGRPVESGEYRGTVAFATTMNPETTLPAADCFDRTLTTYDMPDATLNTLKAGYIQDFTAGRVSKTQNASCTTWYSYTYDGRVDWIIRKVSSMNPISVNYTYDFNGNVTNVVYQKDSVAERFEHIYTYDANLRLDSVFTRALATDTKTLQAKYHYYAHGPLKRLEYGGNLQGVDYTYTENGALKAINDPLLSSDDPGKDGYAGARSGFGKDLFGMALDYFNGDYVRKNTNIGSIAGTDGDSFSGLIKAQRWRTRHANVEPTSADQSWLYRYTYDSRGYLTDANFGTYDRSTTTAVTGDAFSEKGITYDINGNITALTRYSSTNTLMDQIAYTYGNSSRPNQLSKVNDSATDNTFGGLPSGESSFTYNAIGQMVSRTEGGVTEYYNYTPYALVEGVYTDATLTTPKVRYAYDESGFRYWKKEYTTADKTETFYIRDASGNILATYEKKGAASIAQTELPVYGSGRIGVLTRGDMSTTYELSDHLGNVRALFGKDASSAVRMVGYTDYYPYGMTMPNRQYTLGSRYRFGYQGQFAEKDEETGLDHFEARDYDSRLGRWLVNDPARQHWSPYLAMGNNPVSGVDPDGRWDFGQKIWNFFIGNGFNTNQEVIYNNSPWMLDNNGNIKNVAIDEVKFVYQRNSNNGINEANFALTFPGVDKRIYGPTAPNVDCSMFANEVANKVGYTLPRSAYQQAEWYKKNGTFTTDIKKVQLGDHLFWDRGGNAANGDPQYHTGIATRIDGGLQVTHATVRKYQPGSIKTDNVGSNGIIKFWNFSFVGAGRR